MGDDNTKKRPSGILADLDKGAKVKTMSTN